MRTTEERLALYRQKAVEDYCNDSTHWQEHYEFAIKNRAIVLQLEDALVPYDLTLDTFKGDVRAAIAKLVEREIAVHDDPYVSEIARDRRDKIANLETDSKRLREIKKWAEDELQRGSDGIAYGVRGDAMRALLERLR